MKFTPRHLMAGLLSFAHVFTAGGPKDSAKADGGSSPSPSPKSAPPLEASVPRASPRSVRVDEYKSGNFATANTSASNLSDTGATTGVNLVLGSSVHEVTEAAAGSGTFSEVVAQAFTGGVVSPKTLDLACTLPGAGRPLTANAFVDGLTSLNVRVG